MSHQQDRMEISEEAQASLQKRNAQLRQVEIDNKARMLVVPTNEQAVKQMLRSFGEPITYFGEGPDQERDRLKSLIARLQVEQPDLLNIHIPSMSIEAIQATSSLGESASLQEEAMVTEGGAAVTEGPEALKLARLFIANYSLPRAKSRLQAQADLKQKLSQQQQQQSQLQPQQQLFQPNEFLQADIKQKKHLFKRLKKFTSLSSQVGDTRPISNICCTPYLRNSSSQKLIVLTGSFTGLIKAWSAPDCKRLVNFKGHTDRITGLAFHPAIDAEAMEPLFGFDSVEALIQNEQLQDLSSLNRRLAFASASADGTAKLWSMSTPSKPLHTFTGHDHRLCRIAFHPSGRFLGTTSYDGTWRLWDVNDMSCLLVQDGHSRGVYGIAFQNDGALVATSDIGGDVRLWDLRTGKTVIPLEPHAKQVLSVDFHPNGYQFASAGDDNAVRIWDLRQCKNSYTLAAHKKTISTVKFEPIHGRYLVTSSYDKTTKIWRHLEYKLVKTLEGHDNLVMCADIGKCGATSDKFDDYIVTASYDRTWKLWSVDLFD